MCRVNPPFFLLCSISFNIIYGEVQHHLLRSSQCFLSERAVWVVVSRCFNQASMKEDTKIIEDAVM